MFKSKDYFIYCPCGYMAHLISEDTYYCSHCKSYITETA